MQLHLLFFLNLFLTSKKNKLQNNKIKKLNVQITLIHSQNLNHNSLNKFSKASNTTLKI